MNEIDNEDLVSTLEELIDHFGAEMAPYSVTLCTKLVCTLLSLLLEFNKL